MQKILSLILLIFCYTAMPNTAVHADVVLFFSPTRVDISDEKPVQEIRVTNMSDLARSYSLSMHNLVMNENGVTARVDNFDYAAKRMVRFVPRQFIVQPGERQIIRIMARFPEGTEDGDYHSHLEFLENVSRRVELNQSASPERLARMSAEISYSTAIPVIVSKGEVKTDLSIRDTVFTINKDNKPEISMIIERRGNGQGNALFDADYIAPDGTERKAAVRRTAFVYRELGFRSYSYKPELITSDDIQADGKIRLKVYNRDLSESDPIDTVLIPFSNELRKN